MRQFKQQANMDQDLKDYLEGMEARVTGTVGQRLEALEVHLVEKMRDMQTELLRGFEAFSTAQTIRLRKVEADQSNLDAALRGRVEILESRLHQIELRLGLSLLNNPPAAS